MVKRVHMGKFFSRHGQIFGIEETKRFKMEISKRVHLYDSVYYKQQVMDNSTSVMENIGWQPLTMGWIQLNTGGATRVNSVYG
jgi:hypothetical protein